MKQTLSIITLVILLSMSSVHANNSSNNIDKSNLDTGIGFGTGSVVGGMVAGPIGIVSGAFIGSLIGQNTANESNIKHLSNTNLQLEKELSKKSSKLEKLEENSSKQSLILNDAHHTIEKLLTQNHELKNRTLNFDIQFRTNSTHIEKQYHQYLCDLANALNTIPNVEIEVTGFADRIGDEDYNLDLSIKRASKVKDYLIKQGINKDRITTLAHGESQPLHPEASLENNFFDRRVNVYLRPAVISSENIANEITALEDKLSIVNK